MRTAFSRFCLTLWTTRSNTVVPKGASGSTRWPPTRPLPKCPCATMARASRPIPWIASLNAFIARTKPVRASRAAPGSDSRSSNTSSSPTAARSAWKANRGGARPSSSRCHWPDDWFPGQSNSSTCCAGCLGTGCAAEKFSEHWPARAFLKPMSAPDFLARVYDDHAQARFAFLLNFTWNETETKDLLQELFVKLEDDGRARRTCRIKARPSATLLQFAFETLYGRLCPVKFLTRLGPRHGAAIAAGLLLAASFPKPGIAGLAWIAPGLMLFAALGQGGRACFLLGYLAGLAHYLCSLYWLLFIPFPAGAIVGWLALSAYLALYPATWVWLCWRLCPAATIDDRRSNRTAPVG